MSAEIAIRVRGLVTRFGRQTVHEGLELDVRRGEVLGVVGPSGCGKSVLLREITGLDAPTEGEIGFPYAESQGRVPRMGVMFQDGALFSNLTVLENVEAPLREHTRFSDDLRAEIAALKLSMAGLGPD
ncbi:MAG TPA: ATP-binding cassette domain-containing protein, partial [Terricaulis sp.]|nr:ATP-binding cassette domain-containing protein [Terricaulis sp.]